ncbi:Uncharacterized protein dnm_068990 [Desulfonema magnum]|uniref:Uncharacterized protein n=1 Tax=Desulfonema magnum TaxID=45655 RepID=A0A975GRE0_9BACT|nr:Uncharacterized protein dnm_068990 [Desulfonema magnum]
MILSIRSSKWHVNTIALFSNKVKIKFHRLTPVPIDPDLSWHEQPRVMCSDFPII